MTTLFETLEKEFCPPLDTSLLAALLAEIESDNDGKPLSPSSPQLERLRSTLQELAMHADEAQLTEFSDLQLTSATEDTDSSQCMENRTTSCTSYSSGSSSGSSFQPLNSSLGFLRAALPDVPLHVLKKTLKDVEQSDNYLDMWDIIANTLSEESIRELEERGLDSLDEADATFREEDVEWEIVAPRSKKARGAMPTPANKRKNAQDTKVTLVNIRQQHHVKPQRKGSTSRHDEAPLPDLWTQISSIATLLATYLPPHPPALFQSYLHSPQYDTPYKALCAALESICSADGKGNSEEFLTVVFNVLDILSAEYDSLNAEERSRLLHDAELCVRATAGRGDDALDIVKLLRDLDSDAISGNWKIGVYHLPAPSKSPTTATALTPEKRKPHLTVSRAMPKMPSKPPPSRATTPKSKRNPSEWQFIPVRKPPNNGPHPLSLSIPAYNQFTTNGYKVKGGGNGHGKGGKGDVGELTSHQRIAEHQRKRKEYLEQAAKMWQRGDKKSRSGEIAYYYAEKAREFQELAKREALENARIMVLQKRFTTDNHDTIDLHGTTVSEALVIVKEILQESQCSPNQSLKIITGRGSHSTNKIGVLKPAIKNALVKDGWDVGTWDAGLVVRGKRHQVVG